MDNKLIENENNIIFYEGEEGNRKVLRKKEYYNLDMNTKYVIYKLKCPHNSKNFLMD